MQNMDFLQFLSDSDASDLEVLALLSDWDGDSDLSDSDDEERPRARSRQFSRMDEMDNISNSEMIRDEDNPDAIKIKNDVSIEYNVNCDSDAQNIKLDEPTNDTGEGTDEKSNGVKIEIDGDGFKMEDYIYSSDEDVVTRRYKNRKKRSIVPVVSYKDPDPIARDEEEYCATKDYVCDICSHSFMTLAALTKHKKNHDKTIVYTCALCSTTFKTNKELIDHKVVHKNEDREFVCTTKTCNMKFTNHLEFLLHKFVHTKASKLSCVECNKTNITKEYLKLHIQTHYDSNMVECDICHEMVRPASFKIHKTTHGQRPIQCVECGKGFSTPGCLRDHMPQHTGIKIHQCLYCGKGFQRPQNCKIHTRTHTGERPYKCGLCDKAFYQMTDRNYHQARHSKERFECEVCGKKFKGKVSMELHLTTHNNTQKYECKVCGKKLHTNTGLRDHVERVHTDSSYHCEACDRTLSSKKDLRRHLRTKLHQNVVYGLTMKQEEDERLDSFCD